MFFTNLHAWAASNIILDKPGMNSNRELTCIDGASGKIKVWRWTDISTIATHTKTNKLQVNCCNCTIQLDPGGIQGPPAGVTSITLPNANASMQTISC